MKNLFPVKIKLAGSLIKVNLILALLVIVSYSANALYQQGDSVRRTIP
jgi:hypothetical protein